jgi:YVTN family beta-propeller protein
MKKAVVLLLAATCCAASASASVPGRAVRDGVAVDLAVETVGEKRELREGQEAVFRFKISDTATGTPLGGSYPAAWIDFVPDTARVESKGCTERVEELIAGSILARPEVDLNVYYVLALNEDATITVVDPLFGFGSTKLLALIELDSPGEDWALSADRNRLYVSLPESDQIAVIDTRAWKVLSKIAVGPRPTRVALQPDGARLWVTLEGSPEAGLAAIGVIETAQLAVAAKLPAGRGRHELALSDDNRFVYVTNTGDRTLSVFDAARLTRVRDVSLGLAPTSIAFSPLARAVYISGEEAGAVVAVGGEHPLGAGKRPSPADSIVRAPGANAVLVANAADQAIYFYKEGMAAPMGSFRNYSRQPRAVLVVDRSLKERTPGSYETVARLPGPGRYQVAFFLDAPRAVHCFPLTVVADPAAEARRAEQRPGKVESLVDTSRAVRAGEKVVLRFRLSDPRTGQPKDGAAGEGDTDEHGRARTVTDGPDH